MRVRNKKGQILRFRDSHLNKSINKSNENKSNFKLETPVNNKRYPLVFKVRQLLPHIHSKLLENRRPFNNSYNKGRKVYIKEGEKRGLYNIKNGVYISLNPHILKLKKNNVHKSKH